MAKKIELFQSNFNFYQTMGIYPPQLKGNYFLNLRICFFLILLILAFISTASYFFSKANSITERIETFYAALTTLACAGCLLISQYKKRTLLQLKQNGDNFIEKSKFRKLKSNKYS